MKKFASICLASLLTFSLVACNSMSTKEQEGNAANKKDKKIVYATFFPVADLTSRIIGDKMEIHTIIKGTEEPHSFELKPKEVAKLLNADLIVYNGAGMEAFIPDLMDKVGDETKFLDLSKGLTLLTAKSSSDAGHHHGEHEHEHGNHENDKHEHEHGDSHHHSHGDQPIVNPHTWLSVKNVLIQLNNIYEKVITIDPANKDYYQANLEKSTAEFSALDKKFEEGLSKVDKKDKYFVVSHAAFNYLAHDYHLKQIAVTGISPEDEPSAKQLKKIADFVKEHNISTIFFDGKATPKVAETLAKNTGTKTATLYTMESLTDEEIAMGYIKIMEHNLKELIKSFQ